MSVIRLTGIWDDGSPRVDSVPKNPRKEIEIVQNATTDIFLSLVTPSGAPKVIDVSLADNKIVFTARVRPGTGKVIEVEATSEGLGEYKFSILPAATSSERPRRLFYDIWAKEGAVQMPSIPDSPMNLVASLADL